MTACFKTKKSLGYTKISKSQALTWLTSVIKRKLICKKMSWLLAIDFFNAAASFSWDKPPIYLHLTFAIVQFEISNWIFSVFKTWILQATADRKIKTVKQTWYFKLDNFENQVKIDRGIVTDLTRFSRFWILKNLIN